jgi:hypothetical protein
MKSFTITTLLKLQSMQLPNTMFNTMLRNKAVQAQNEFKNLFGYENKGLARFIGYYGTPTMKKLALKGK